MPGDTKPHKARQAKRRRRIRKIGSLANMRRKLWQAITSAHEVLLDDQSDAVMVLKATHAITSASTAYARLVETGELEARVSLLERTLEKSMESRKNGRAYA